MKALRFSVTVPQYALLKALGRIDRRVYYRGPLATVRLVDVAEPALLSPDWIKIRTLYCGFCGSDINLIFLKDSPMASPFTSFPCVMGHEFSGEVVEAGGNVTEVKAGDRVTVAPSLGCKARGITPECPACAKGRPGNCENFAEGALAPGMFLGICRDTGGGFAPYLVAPKDLVFRLPDGVSAKEGAMMEPFSVALQAVLDNTPREGEHVLVVGGGVIGSLIVQAIRLLAGPCSITVAEPSPFHAELVRKAGVDGVIADGRILDHAKSITGARGYKPMLGGEVLMGGFSRIFDTVGTTATLNAGLRSLGTQGVLSIVAIGKEVMTDLTPLWLKLQTIKGVYCYGYTEAGGARRHVYELALDFARQKKVRLDEMITHTFPLEDYARMIEVNLHKGRYRALKTAVVFEDSG